MLLLQFIELPNAVQLVVVVAGPCKASPASLIACQRLIQSASALAVAVCTHWAIAFVPLVKPSAVLALVDSPPCKLHLPLCLKAGRWQAKPFRVLAKPVIANWCYYGC